MPLLGYKKRFAPMVEAGTKRQTIRAFRKDGRDPKPGETLFQYTGLRTPACRKLREDVCKSTHQITIESDLSVVIGIKHLNVCEEQDFARADGFNSANDFFDFFQKTHSLPFHGLLIKW